MFTGQRHARSILLITAVAHALTAGCAGLRCPRIDPTGERFLIWPKDQPAVASVAVPTNPLAPPVLTDQVFPQPATPSATSVLPASATFPPATQDTLTLTPNRVLAPVGSEVVLKASICTTAGYTLADQKIEWMLGRNGVGQFVEVGGKGCFHPPLLPWYRGAKVDNYLANGYTANGPLCIDRGTANPADDVNINRGDAWISVTSPNEGTSHVTAFTPAVESWDQRKAAATIYWVDVQWAFPPASVAASGRGETLTTVVTRQSDGTPLAGWIVRYEVADGGGSAASVSEITTGADGKASALISPTTSGAPSSQINVQLIRPANFGGSDAPRLIVGSGTTLVNWSAGAQPYLPPSTTAPSTSAAPPAQSSPWPAGQQDPITPQPQLPTAGPPRLELRLSGPTEATVGANAPLRVSIRNVGETAATNVKLTDAFDPALYTPLQPTSRTIARVLGTLPPGQGFDEELPFQVNKAGRLCHEVTVEFAEGAAVSQTHCVTVAEPPPQLEGAMRVNIDGPRQAVVGERVTFKIAVVNTGQTPLVDVKTIEEFPPAFLQPLAVQPGVDVVSGTIQRTIDRIEVGGRKEWEVECLCRQATIVTPMVRAEAQTDPPGRNILTTADECDLEILPARTDGAAGAAPPGAGQPALAVRVSFQPTPARVNTTATCIVTVTNRSATMEQQVATRVIFPAELKPDLANTLAPAGVQGRLEGGVATFSPLAALPPNESIEFRIPINPTATGFPEVTAGVISDSTPLGVSTRERLEVTNRL